MNKGEKLDQAGFMYVKQRLDYYRLPSSFPIETLGLLTKLLGMLDQNDKERLYERENVRYE